MSTTEALQLAAEMLEGYVELIKSTGSFDLGHYIPEVEQTAEDLRAALAAAAPSPGAEPVAFANRKAFTTEPLQAYAVSTGRVFEDDVPLYAAPGAHPAPTAQQVRYESVGQMLDAWGHPDTRNTPGAASETAETASSATQDQRDALRELAEEAQELGMGYGSEPDVVTALKACLQCFDEMTGRKPGFVVDSIAMSKEAIAKYEAKTASVAKPWADPLRDRYAQAVQRVEGEVPAEPSDSASFKNFHRSLCARFGYTHDERDWRRDLVSLEEWITKLVTPEGQAEHLIQAAISASPEPLQALGRHLSDWLDEDKWATAEKLLLALATPPARDAGLSDEKDAQIKRQAEFIEGLQSEVSEWKALAGNMDVAAYPLHRLLQECDEQDDGLIAVEVVRRLASEAYAKAHAARGAILAAAQEKRTGGHSS